MDIITRHQAHRITTRSFPIVEAQRGRRTAGQWATALGWLVTTVFTGSVLAQDKPPADKAPTPAPEGDDRAEMTAEDLLRALQRNRPQSDVVQPTGSSNDRRDPVPRLLPEGASIIDREGHLERRGDDWALVPNDPKSGDPLRLLPNAMLEVMIRTAAGASEPTSFIVSGDVTAVKAANWLLVRTAMRAHEPPASSLSTPTINEPGAVPATAEQTQPPSAEAVLQALRADRPAREAVEDDLMVAAESAPPGTASPLLSGLDDATDFSSASSAQMRRTLRPDGTIFPRQTGRFVTQGDRRLFVPESNHPDHPAPPLELLPSLTTEYMASLWARNPHGLVFVVSGELTLFAGTNYLLPRVAIRQLASDNLRK